MPQQHSPACNIIICTGILLISMNVINFIVPAFNFWITAIPSKIGHIRALTTNFFYIMDEAINAEVKK